MKEKENEKKGDMRRERKVKRWKIKNGEQGLTTQEGKKGRRQDGKNARMKGAKLKKIM